MAAAAACDRASMLQAFDDTKAGVKGLVDAGVTKIPPFFVHPTERPSPATVTNVQIPVIDLRDVDSDAMRRKNAVDDVKRASEAMGFFQVVNHGVPLDVLDEMVRAIRCFHEQDVEAKEAFYTRDYTKKVLHNCNFDLYRSPAANWRDSLYCSMAPEPPMPEELPLVCREIFFKYTAYVRKLGTVLFELISEALGLDRNHLIEMECARGLNLVGHYYPACPEPDLTFGNGKHCDPDFLTILLQDSIGGLQVSPKGEWIDVPPLRGALVINLGDLLQLISNNKFKSIEHRVLSKNVGPRISVACFFRTLDSNFTRLYGPIQELTSKENPAVYRAVTIREYVSYFNSKGLDGKPTIDHFKL